MSSEPHPRSIDIAIEKLERNDSLLERLKSDPLATLRNLSSEVKAENPPPRATEDKVTYRTAVAALSAVVLGVVGVVAYKWFGSNDPAFKIPEMLVAMGSTALGALAGLLMPGGPQRG